MRLKNRTINNVKIVTDINTHSRSTCYRCKIKGDGIMFSMYRPQKGKRFICYSCLMKTVLADVISKYEQHKEPVMVMQDESVNKPNPEPVAEIPVEQPRTEELPLNTVTAEMEPIINEDTKPRKRKRNESERAE